MPILFGILCREEKQSQCLLGFCLGCFQCGRLCGHIVIGEGGSGGALAFAVADEVWMMEHAIYSILSPEGFATILWKDSKRAKEAAAIMKLTAADLKKLGIVEHVIREKEPLNRGNIGNIAKKLDLGIAVFLRTYGMLEEEKLLDHRYQRFRRIGTTR